MGRGDRHGSDQAAVEAMRRVLDTVPIAGTVVIGEGERDEAPMLFIGEKVGLKQEYSETVPEIDIAVDPLEGTNLCAMGVAGAITVLAASEHGGLLHAPDCYMEKIVVEPAARGAVDLDAPVKDNLRAIARRMERDVEDLVVVVLDRPRHEKLIADIRAAGARIRLIPDGDLSAGIAAAVVGTGVHAVMGTGGAPEGVLTAAALRCLNGEILGRLVIKDEAQAERFKSMGIRDHKKVYTTAELAPGREMIFALPCPEWTAAAHEAGIADELRISSFDFRASKGVIPWLHHPNLRVRRFRLSLRKRGARWFLSCCWGWR